ncbi:MAG TPA: magnesium transporter CorA family protein [Acidimicrobiales bacterium]|nr:magnesium transporter CorA family protein [Acidimicrobiales bacterium]
MAPSVVWATIVGALVAWGGDGTEAAGERDAAPTTSAPATGVDASAGVKAPPARSATARSAPARWRHRRTEGEELRDGAIDITSPRYRGLPDHGEHRVTSEVLSHPGMASQLVTMDGSHLEPTRQEVERLLASSAPFWLDLEVAEATGAAAAPGGQAGSTGWEHRADWTGWREILANTFHFHPLALEDAEHFGQRPKLDAYDNFTFLVVYGPDQHGDLVEVHCFYAKNFLVTVHRRTCPAFGEVLKRLQMSNEAVTVLMVFYRLVDSLVDGYFPILSLLDDQIDELEDEILRQPTEEQLGQLFDLKRSLIALRKIVTPQRDVFATLVGSDALPGMTPETERYFRDIYDHLVRVNDLVDSYRDLMSGALDTHLSTVSNRLNVVMKQLTIIATVFLPLSFLTGFFGQNFSWMTNHLSGLAVFLSVGIGTQVLVVVGLVVMFRKRGWLSSDATVPPPVPSRRQALPLHLRWATIRPLHGPRAKAGPPATK